MPNDLLGDSGVVVKIDETKIGQRKYNVDELFVASGFLIPLNTTVITHLLFQ